MESKKVELNIFRYDPSSDGEPRYDKVEVEVDADMPTTVLDLLCTGISSTANAKR